MSGMPSPPIRLRPAVPADRALLFEWRNDPTAYQHYRTPAPVTPDSHRVWFAALLGDPNRRLFIVETTTGVPIGQLRFDRHGETVEVTMAIAAAQRDRGFGRAALAAACAAYTVSFPNSRAITAEIAADNAASLALFTSSGFRAVGQRSQFLVFELPRESQPSA